MNILSKEDFVNAINSMKRVSEFWDEIDGVLHKYECGYPVMPDCFVEFIRTLEIMFDDTDKWIDYFCLELDFGKEWYHRIVVDENNEDIPLKTPEDLYELLMNNMGVSKNGQKNTA